MADFASLGLSPEVLRAINEMGFEEPSPIQQQAVPLLLAGRDLIAQAVTGTGKTAAFGILIAERLDPNLEQVQAIVLAPTRELAVQVSEELYRLGRFRGLRVVPIYGGQPYDRQLRALRSGAQIVVATPGRLLDHMRRGTIDLRHVSIFVLDEADEMLNMGFLEDVEYVLERVPARQQTAFFSATMPEPIRKLASRFLNRPASIALPQPRGMTVPTISQRYYEVPFRYKFEALTRLLDVEQPRLALVFCATKRMVDEVAEGLRGRGYRVDSLHGDIGQAQRERAIRAAREGRVDIIVATDVAARGLDIEQVSHVINYDLPQDPEYYVHRIGRTGRAGRTGEAITFVNPWQMNELRVIERILGTKIVRAEIPTAAEMAEREQGALTERLLDALMNGQWGRYRQIVENVSADHDLVDIAAAAIYLADQARRRSAGRRPVGATTELDTWLATPRRRKVEPKASPSRGRRQRSRRHR